MKGCCNPAGPKKKKYSYGVTVSMCGCGLLGLGSIPGMTIFFWDVYIITIFLYAC